MKRATASRIRRKVSCAGFARPSDQLHEASEPELVRRCVPRLHETARMEDAPVAGSEQELPSGVLPEDTDRHATFSESA